MKFSSFALVAALAAREAAAHATFQQFWVNGVDQGTKCARLPSSNSPVTDLTSNNIRCNVGTSRAASNCAVAAGDTVTVEMHQQNGDRSCSNEAIGGQHYGPVNVYMSKVSDAATADGSKGWFKIFADSWRTSGKSGSSTSDNDFWGTKDLNSCCGKMELKIPSDIPAGDYLLRAEALALHSAASAGGAQFYMTCFQVTVSGGGSASPATVNFPGAYKATDPGILVNIHYPALSNYVNPGPAVYSGGSTKQAGSACGAGSNSPAPSSDPTTTAKPTTLQTTTVAQPTTTNGGGGGSGCTVAKYGQCGGQGYNGCTNCSGSTCTPSGQYYSQCL